MNQNPLIPPNFVTLRQLKELKEKREEEERLKKVEKERLKKEEEEGLEKEEEERLRKLKVEEEGKERVRLRKLEDDKNSVNVPSKPLDSNSRVPQRRRPQRSANLDAREDVTNLKAWIAVSPDARDDANFKGQVAANGTVDESRKKAKKKRNKKKKMKKKEAVEEKEDEITQMPVDVNGAGEGRRGSGDPTNKKAKDKKSREKNISGPVRVLGPDLDPIEDVEEQVSDLNSGGKDPNQKPKANPYRKGRNRDLRRGGKAWVYSRRGGGGGGMMWVKKTAES